MTLKQPFVGGIRRIEANCDAPDVHGVGGFAQFATKSGMTGTKR